MVECKSCPLGRKAKIEALKNRGSGVKCERDGCTFSAFYMPIDPQNPLAYTDQFSGTPLCLQYYLALETAQEDFYNAHGRAKVEAEQRLRAAEKILKDFLQVG